MIHQQVLRAGHMEFTHPYQLRHGGLLRIKHLHEVKHRVIHGGLPRTPDITWRAPSPASYGPPPTPYSSWARQPQRPQPSTPFDSNFGQPITAGWFGAGNDGTVGGGRIKKTHSSMLRSNSPGPPNHQQTTSPNTTSQLSTSRISSPYSKDDQYIGAFMSGIVYLFKDIAQLKPLFRDQITNFSINQVAANVFEKPDKLADFAAAVSTGEVQELQDDLESLVVDDRLRKALVFKKRNSSTLNSKVNYLKT